MMIEDLMVRSLVTVTPEQTLRDAGDLMRSKHIRHLPVVHEGHLVGIVTDRDVKRATPSLLGGIDRDAFDLTLDTTKVSQFMTREPMTISPETRVKAAVKIFIERKVGALPVVTGDGRLVGIVTEIDLLRAFDRMLTE